MPKPLKPGDRITFVDKVGFAAVIAYGVVTNTSPDRFQSACAYPALLLWWTHYGPYTALRFVCDYSEEGVTWIRGFARPWWPPHRKRCDALLAAYALAADTATVDYVVDPTF